MANAHENPHIHPFTIESSDGSAITNMGLTLIDHFAGQAMQGMLANPRLTLTEDQVSQWAYVVAEAMLKEHKRRMR